MANQNDQKSPSPNPQNQKDEKGNKQSGGKASQKSGDPASDVQQSGKSKGQADHGQSQRRT